MTTVFSRHGMREMNSEQVLRAILREGPLARVDLAQRVGLTPAAVSNITRELIENGVLCEVGTARGGRVGAHAILLDFPEDTPVIGTVHQGVSALRIALCNLRGKVLVRRSVATPERYTPAWATETIAQTLSQLLHAQGHVAETLVGIGAGLVGLVDVRHGVVRRAPSLGWEDVPFGKLLFEQFHLPVALENNVRAMAFGEALLGQGRAWSDFAFVYVGTGIGSGLIIDGRPYRGAHGGAGEIGHITVDPSSEVCSCGNHGCLETIAAEPAIIRSALSRGIELDTSEGKSKDAVRALASLARMRDEAAGDVVKNCGKSLGIGLANLVDIFNPGRIFLHGAITGAGEIFSASVTHSLQEHAFLTRDESIELVAPTFGDDAGLVGAAAVALDAIILNGRFKEEAKAGFI